MHDAQSLECLWLFFPNPCDEDLVFCSSCWIRRCNWCPPESSMVKHVEICRVFSLSGDKIWNRFGCSRTQKLLPWDDSAKETKRLDYQTELKEGREEQLTSSIESQNLNLTHPTLSTGGVRYFFNTSHAPSVCCLRHFLFLSDLLCICCATCGALLPFTLNFVPYVVPYIPSTSPLLLHHCAVTTSHPAKIPIRTVLFSWEQCPESPLKGLKELQVGLWHQLQAWPEQFSPPF